MEILDINWYKEKSAKLDRVRSEIHTMRLEVDEEYRTRWFMILTYLAVMPVSIVEVLKRLKQKQNEQKSNS